MKSFSLKKLLPAFTLSAAAALSLSACAPPAEEAPATEPDTATAAPAQAAPAEASVPAENPVTQINVNKEDCLVAGNYDNSRETKDAGRYLQQTFDFNYQIVRLDVTNDANGSDVVVKFDDIKVHATQERIRNFYRALGPDTTCPAPHFPEAVDAPAPTAGGTTATATPAAPRR